MEKPLCEVSQVPRLFFHNFSCNGYYIQPNGSSNDMQTHPNVPVCGALDLSFSLFSLTSVFSDTSTQRGEWGMCLEWDL